MNTKIDELKQRFSLSDFKNKSAVKGLAFRIVQKSGREHPFQDEKAGRAWFDGFRRRHPRLTIRKPQPLSYCRALCFDPETIKDFFGKLGSIYGG